MARKVEVEVYTFDELSDSAKDRARDWWRNGLHHDEWWENVYDMAKEAGAILGIDIDRIYFSGFWSQGDGASFEGTYSYRKGWRKSLRSEFCGDMLAKLEAIGNELQAAQKRVFYTASASVSLQGRGVHSGCMWVAVDMDEDIGQEVFTEVADDITDALRGFADLIYRWLEDEYEYLTSDEAVDENIIANGYEFTADGEHY